MDLYCGLFAIIVGVSAEIRAGMRAGASSQCEDQRV